MCDKPLLRCFTARDGTVTRLRDSGNPEPAAVPQILTGARVREVDKL
jgi:hypothetical protein